jgi:hypothetical protein
MAKLLIGTDADQVSFNGMLGELAFQNRDSVEIRDGSAALSQLSLNALYKQISVSAVDVFVYDTSKDSDGGAWRRRTQNTSWYNETLNTATRGSRKEFPAVAVIVATAATLTIYDGDSPDLPMWMVFNKGPDANPTNWWDGNNANSATAVWALNGLVMLTTSAAGSYGADFIGERYLSFYSIQTNSGYRFQPGGLEYRNQAVTSRVVSQQFNGYAVGPLHYDVSMTVLPNAPIDSATGLAVPTIAIATNNGVNVITDSGVVYSLTPESEPAYNNIKSFFSVAFTQDYGIILTDRQTAGGFSNAVYLPYYKYNTSLSDTYSKLTGSFSYEWSGDIRNNLNGPGSIVSYWGVSDSSRLIKFSCKTKDSIVLGTTKELVLIEPFGKGLIANIKSNFTTGWMPGDIKGVWLSDTTTETLLKTELIVNGDFSNGTTGWTASSGGSISVTSGVLRITNGSTNGRAVSTVFPTVVGKQYRVKVTSINRSSSNVSYRLEVRGPELAWNWTSAITQEVYFTAVGTTTYIELYALGGTSEWVEFDNASVTEGDADRSYYANPLELFGTIVKTPVATGAELVAYSGWTNSANYLETTVPSIGTGDFCSIQWVNCPSNDNGYDHFMAIGGQTSSTGFTIKGWKSSGGLVPYLYSANGNDNGTYDANITMNYNVWNFLIIGRKNGIFYVYINGRLRNTGSNNAYNISSTNLRIGSGFIAEDTTSRISLSRLSFTFPSNEQIAKMYNDEKRLFQNNARATIYGTSNVVTGLAYDEDTQLLHVGTSSGRSMFNGLQRVDYTTTAVATSISAADGLVAEN